MILELLTWIGYIFVALLIGVVTAGIIYARWNYGVLENTPGLPAVVKPYFIGGSDPFFYKGVCCEDDLKRVKKYGPVFGYYEGRESHIYISDPELIRSIFIKDFDHFQNKRMGDAGHEFVNEMLDILPYEKWKAVRAYLSPQLTTGKIKAMSYQMMDGINDWIASIKRKADGKQQYKFDPKPTFAALTLDVIARTAFGTKLNALDDPNSTFMAYAKRFSLEDIEPGLLFTAVQTFPFLAALEPFFPKEVMDFFGEMLRSILKTRRESGQRAEDFVDVMNDMIEKCSSGDSEYKRLGITETTAMCQAMIFLFAGFETTASTMTAMAYQLSTHPEIQDKLIKEIDSFYDRHDGKIDQEFVRELVYLEACVNETLRINPPAIRTERVCTKDWSHEPSGLKLKKGMVIQVPIYAVHYDEKYFPSPNEWRPERFLPENKDKLNPYAFLSFGQGPHNCIGSRFARLELATTIAEVLKSFRFENYDNAKLVMKPGRAFLTNFEPFNLYLEPRF